MRKALTILLLLCFGVTANAQTEPEYLMEIGGGIGMMSYEGDLNGSIIKGLHPSAAIVLRRLVNPRQGYKLQLGYGSIKGSSANLKTVYPDYSTENYNTPNKVYKFSNSLIDINATYEYNFWPFGTGREYRGAKRLTPFIAIGLGGTVATGDSGLFTLNMPIGVGIKYKLGDRLNLNVDWTMHFTMSDKLDGMKDPYRVESAGIFKNTDCYSALQISLTYSFHEKCRVCHNQDE